MTLNLTCPVRQAAVLARKASFGPPNCDQLSMHRTRAVLPSIAEQAVEPIQEPISR